jgi:glycerol-3-phosphate acyltransferase PlsY
LDRASNFNSFPFEFVFSSEEEVEGDNGLVLLINWVSLAGACRAIFVTGLVKTFDLTAHWTIIMAHQPFNHAIQMILIMAFIISRPTDIITVFVCLNTNCEGFR